MKKLFAILAIVVTLGLGACATGDRTNFDCVVGSKAPASNCHYGNAE